jgi:hypothetical protein
LFAPVRRNHDKVVYAVRLARLETSMKPDDFREPRAAEGVELAVSTVLAVAIVEERIPPQCVERVGR